MEEELEPKRRKADVSTSNTAVAALRSTSSLVASPLQLGNAGSNTIPKPNGSLSNTGTASPSVKTSLCTEIRQPTTRESSGMAVAAVPSTATTQPANSTAVVAAIGLPAPLPAVLRDIPFEKLYFCPPDQSGFPWLGKEITMQLVSWNNAQEGQRRALIEELIGMRYKLTDRSNIFRTRGATRKLSGTCSMWWKANKKKGAMDKEGEQCRRCRQKGDVHCIFQLSADKFVIIPPYF